MRHEFEADVMFLGDRPSGRLLDVGSGDGALLHRMQLHGWDAWGIEAIPELVEFSKIRHHVSVIEGRIEDVELPDSRFQAITMGHLIEPVADPIRVVEKCLRALEPGGVVVVVTPNVRSMGHSMFRERWMHLDPPRHFHLFTRENLDRCATSAGLRPLDGFTLARGAGGVYRVSRALNRRESGGLAGERTPYGLTDLAFLLKESVINTVKKEIGEELVLVARGGDS